MKVLNFAATIALGTILAGCNGTSDFADARSVSLPADQSKSVTPASTPIPDTIATRRIEAQRYVEVSPPSVMVKEMAKSMAEKLPDMEGEELVKIFSEYLDWVQPAERWCFKRL